MFDLMLNRSARSFLTPDPGRSASPSLIPLATVMRDDLPYGSIFGFIRLMCWILFFGEYGCEGGVLGAEQTLGCIFNNYNNQGPGSSVTRRVEQVRYLHVEEIQARKRVGLENRIEKQGSWSS
jgi:hypothetical protein